MPAANNHQIIVSGTILLRLPEEADAAVMAQIIRDNHDRFVDYFPWAKADYTENDAKEFINYRRTESLNGKSKGYVIVVEGRLVGSVGFHFPFDRENRKGALGYWIDSRYEGRGIVTKSVKALVDHVFRHESLKRINIFCAEQNTRSRSVPERLGFTQESIEADGQWCNGRFLNMVVFRMLQRDWK